MSFLYPLCSSSKGNCTYIGTKESGVLVDAGVGIRNFKAHLALIGVEPAAIQGIFVTHEHSDHVKGLARIQKELGVPVYSSAGTLQALREKGILSVQTPVFRIGEKAVCVADMEVKAFPTPHDCAESQGYVIETADHRKAAICTDLGYVPEHVHACLQDCDLVLLESNYEPTLLQMGIYPPYLKRRIAGRHGHLSNDDCTDEICRLLDLGVERFVLGHLSEENNRPELAFESVLAALTCKGAKLDKDFQLSVAPKTNTGKCFELA